mmetsp:Transcript_54797/g.151692  ORF Transcript_54797/g.151692 Transcript_54797/m.151692 type:complete len:85 (+) Transcript_54797:387-641(+)
MCSQFVLSERIVDTLSTRLPMTDMPSSINIWQNAAMSRAEKSKPVRHVPQKPPPHGTPVGDGYCVAEPFTYALSSGRKPSMRSR